MMGVVAAIQINACHSLQKNLMLIEQQLCLAVDAGAKLVLLPEHCAGLSSTVDQIVDFVEPLGDGPAQKAFSVMAKEYGVWLVVGALPVSLGDDKRVYSSSLVYDNHGELVARYAKIHLFDVKLNDQLTVQESDKFAAGDQVVTVDTPVGRIGLSICYDLRFPELYRELSQQQATILLVPAAFLAHTGKAHWEVLLRARAIENTCYVVAANQHGLRNNGIESHGHSMVVGPWGQVIDQLADGDGHVLADISQQDIDDVRHRLPALSHRTLG